MKNRYTTIIFVFFLTKGFSLLAQGQTIPNFIILENRNIVGCPCPPYEAAQSIIIKPNTSILPTYGQVLFKISPDRPTITYISYSQNFIYTKTFQNPFQNAYEVTNRNDIIENITYFDGLGRPVQNNFIKHSPSRTDIITHIEYDNLGRQSQDFLPYSSASNPNGAYIDPVASRVNVSKQYGAYPFPPNPGFEQTNYPYSYKSFETSPLSRVLKKSAPGNDWAIGSGHEIKIDYLTNTAVDAVKKYETKLDSSDKIRLLSNSFYDTGELMKNIIKDENWTAADDKIRTTEEYKDKEGRVILKRTYSDGVNNIIAHDTDYVYDEYGNLSFVIPPLVDRTTIIGQDNAVFAGCDADKYDPFSTSITRQDFGPGTGGGSIIISIVGNELKINGYMYSTSRTNLISNVPLATTLTNSSTNYVTVPKKLSDFDLGIVNPEGYTAKIINGNFIVTKSTSNLLLAEVVNINNKIINLGGGCGAGSAIVGNQTILDNLCYQYKYDDRNRLVEKKLPGKDWEYIIYDKLDRPILTQDANLRLSNKWLFTKYDAFSRPVYTGEYTNTVQTTRSAMQTIAEQNTTLFETKQPAERTINGTKIYYTNNAFPNLTDTDTKVNLFTISYYDNYSFDLNGGTAESVGGLATSTATKSLATGSKIRILGTTHWITNVIYYDSKGRPIYNYSKNDFLGVTQKIKSELDFVGKPNRTITHHTNGSTTVSLVDSFIYDHVGRLKKQTQSINGAAEEIIAENTYDELGQLVSKGVGGKGSTRLQNIDYTYNIRGWLKGINDTSAANNLITTGPGDLFGFKINYNKPSDGIALFNGNISQTFWKTTGIDSGLKNYTYYYDQLNRLTGAISQDTGRYNESLSYDKNGNILSLLRKGYQDANATQLGIMDDLVYTYDSGNKLFKVKDKSNSTMGFIDGIDTAQEYSYDDNGNMITDGNKGITAITYNHLNLPIDITLSAGTIHYDYDATGVKQRKRVSSITTDYANGFQYEKVTSGVPVLKFFPQPEGYVSYNAGNYDYIYQYKDHLGNVRLSYDKNLAIIEESNYYPFGLKQKVAGEIINNSSYKYKYNGKELQDELGLNMYDYGARNYDPALGRWMNIDPLAEVSRRFSPYTYALDNPVFFIDPDGMKAEAGQSGNYYDWDEGIYKNKDTGKQVGADVAISSHSGNGNGTPPDDYVFNENGDYVRTDKNNKPDALIVENSKTGARRSYGFADPKEDPKNIKNGFINKLQFVSVTQISEMIKQQGGYKAENGSWMAFYEKSKGGQNFDYTFSVLSSSYHNAANSLYLPKGGDGLAHNLMNFGNFLWAATGYSLGFDYSTLKMAAHANSLFNSGSNGYSPQLDSKDDQRSILSGATYSAMYGFKFFVEK